MSNLPKNTAQKLEISQKLIDRLSQAKHSQFGTLYGIVTKKKLTVLELELGTDNGPHNSLLDALPAEIYVCGVIQLGDGSFARASILQALSEVDITDNPVFLNYNIESGQLQASLCIDDKLEESKFTAISEQDFLGEFLYLRLCASVPLSCDLTPNEISNSFDNLRKSVASGVLAFHLDDTNVYLFGGDCDNLGSTIGELADDGDVGGRKKKAQVYGVDVRKVSMLRRRSGGNDGEERKEHAPLCVLDKKQCKTLTFSVPLDALSVVQRQTKLSDLYEILVESTVRNLKLVEKSLLEGIDSVSFPEILHFYPDECAHFLSTVYLKQLTEENLLRQRHELHQALLLTQQRPTFKRANKFTFLKNEMLVNPHQGLKPTDNGGKLSLVKGKYAYYHYCQNKMDDNGWGCAYRSLQTLASWFKYQGYTDREVPSFQDIQQCLVDIGDKPRSFIGSKQWIGSTEVNFVLNTLLGVTSKILYVSSGEEMAGKGPELASHFENHGSPVMIGGGVLAHTILGVDYNAQTGNLMFLILDPHYTGGEDLNVVQNKGWCGWKSVDFWNKTAYYNMCLPQVPKVI